MADAGTTEKRYSRDVKRAAMNELSRRVTAMSTMRGFVAYTFPKYQWNWHHTVICELLDSLLARGEKRIMLFTPPRHGKTELVSRRFPAYVLGRSPDTAVIAASYSADLARSVNRDVQRIIDADEYRRIFPGTRLNSANIRSVAGAWLRNTDEFEVVGHRGRYKSVGVGGGITGRGFDIGIIDDPIKDRMEASSRVYRDRVWDWYNAVFFTRRQGDNSAVILVQTRWHHDDLAGRILRESPEKWTVVSLPAIREHGVIDNFDMRQPGEPLWPGLFNIDSLNLIHTQIGDYEWSALYQQSPSVKKGGLFKVDRFKVIPQIDMSRVMKSVRYWDKAGTADGGCYTAGILMHCMDDNTVVISDVVRGRWGAGDRETRIKSTAELDGPEVVVWLEQEPGSGGKESAENTVRNLLGFRAFADRVTGDKATRAEPYASQVDVGNVYLVDRPWVRDFLEEHEMFPYGKYKDQVDAAAGAFSKMFANRINPHVSIPVGGGEEITELDRQIAELEAKVKYDRVVGRSITAA